jgi:hypothetical protein
VRTLFVFGEGPYRARSGSPMQMWQNIEVLATRGPVFAFSIGGAHIAADTPPPPFFGWLHVDRAEYEVKPAPRVRTHSNASISSRQRREDEPAQTALAGVHRSGPAGSSWCPRTGSTPIRTRSRVSRGHHRPAQRRVALEARPGARE